MLMQPEVFDAGQITQLLDDVECALGTVQDRCLGRSRAQTLDSALRVAHFTVYSLRFTFTHS